MGWKFWQKKTGEGDVPKVKKLPKPKDLPTGVGRFLVVDMKLDPDWVWNLKSVSAPREDRSSFDIRIFDEAEASAKDVWIKDFATLENHRDLILFEGWYDKNTWKMDIHDVRNVRDAAA